MKRIHLFFTLLFFSVFAQAQVDTDSLRSVINSQRPYTEKMNATISLVQHFELTNFDSAIITGTKALQTARKNADSVSVAELKHHIGVANYFNGKYDQAAKNFYESVTILEKKKDKKRLAPVYNALAKLYRKTKDLDRAVENYKKANAIYTALKDTSGISMILNEASGVYEYK